MSSTTDVLGTAREVIRRAAIDLAEAVAAAYGLTRREAQVLALWLLGHDQRSCADAMGINHRTVKSHTKSVIAKLDATNMREALRVATACVAASGAHG